MKVTLTLTFDDATMAALAVVADGRGMKTRDLLEETMTQSVQRLLPRRPGEGNPYAKDVPIGDPDLRRTIRRLWVEGQSAIQINRLMGIGNVRKVRSTLHDLGYDTSVPAIHRRDQEQETERLLAALNERKAS